MPPPPGAALFAVPAPFPRRIAIALPLGYAGNVVAFQFLRSRNVGMLASYAFRRVKTRNLFQKPQNRCFIPPIDERSRHYTGAICFHSFSRQTARPDCW